MTGLLARMRDRLWSRRPKPVILMYHRVATPRVDPWDLAVHGRRKGKGDASEKRARIVVTPALAERFRTATVRNRTVLGSGTVSRSRVDDDTRNDRGVHGADGSRDVLHRHRPVSLLKRSPFSPSARS